jgi:hypothetical protein
MTPFSFHIIVNEAAPLSWPDIIWTDAKRLGAIHRLLRYPAGCIFYLTVGRD